MSIEERALERLMKTAPEPWYASPARLAEIHENARLAAARREAEVPREALEDLAAAFAWGECTWDDLSPEERRAVAWSDDFGHLVP